MKPQNHVMFNVSVLLQVDDPVGEAQPEKSKDDAQTSQTDTHTTVAKKKKKRTRKSANYKGYEALLEVENISDEDELPIARGRLLLFI